MSLSLSRFFIFLTTILFSFSLLGISTIDAKDDSTTIILEELPGIDNEGFKAALQSDHPGEAAGYYINGLLTFGIGLATVLAVLMITIGGFQYITTDSFMQKSEGKKRIQDSLMGLGLILVSYILLGTINSDLLKIRFGLSPISLETEPVSITFDVEEITTAGVKLNNENLINMCKGVNDEPENISLPNETILEKVNAATGKQIKELEGHKQDAERARSFNMTHVIADLSSQNPSSFGWRIIGRQYANYRPKRQFQDPNCGGNFEDDGQCFSIEAYIKHIDNIIAKINNLNDQCEKILK